MQPIPLTWRMSRSTRTRNEREPLDDIAGVMSPKALACLPAARRISEALKAEAPQDANNLGADFCPHLEAPASPSSPRFNPDE